MSNVSAEHCEWINPGCTASSTEKQNSGNEIFWARHWWGLTQFSPHCVRIWSGRFLWLQRKQICFCCLTQTTQCELPFLYQEKNTNASQAWTNLSHVAFCRWGNEISVRGGFAGSWQFSRDCFAWLISALPSCFSQSLTPLTRCWSPAASALVSSLGDRHLGASPQCRSWLWCLLQASGLVLGGAIYAVLCLQTCRPPELSHHSPLWRLHQDRHSCWLPVSKTTEVFSCEEFWSTPAQK